MASPPIPPSLDHLATHPFSFYPAIVGIEHNEWLFRKATWSEILVVNCKTDNEIWIPRRFIGEVSRIDDPVLIVGLNKELEYRAGTVWPYQRRVIQMPHAVGGVVPPTTAVESRPDPAPIVGIRVKSNTDSRMFKLVGGVLAAGILIYLGAVNLTRVGDLRQRVVYSTHDQSYLDLTSHDDYFAVVQKLGKPASEHWQTETGAIQYQALVYPNHRFIVILMGGDRQSATYIGTMDENWTPVHSVELRSGGTTFAMLRGLKRF